ncbi:transmembrane secretion effector family protein [Bacillus clarus]|uniref:Transmembrane secretion effector family protein n=1 Tax=Bacillus clarus TaxID=2338372 RepID=A0A090YIP8_9BACI|nr:transmembrane secretion effector family protein [Bacillus clarus]
MLFIHFKLYDYESNEDRFEGEINFITDIKGGFYYLMDRKSIKNTFIILVSINFFLGFAVTVPFLYIINTVLHLSSKEFGMIQGAFPVGMILGAILVKKITDRFSYSFLLKYLSFMLAVFMIVSGSPFILIGVEIDDIIYVIFTVLSCSF